jgi:hypothetical protein
MSELEDVRQKLQSTIAELNQAKDILKFYGNPHSYKCDVCVHTGHADQCKLQGDSEELDHQTRIAGKRARDFLKRDEQ